MKKIVIIFIFIYLHVNAQKSSGTVKYNLSIGYDEGFSNSPSMKDIYQQAVDGAQKLSFILTFNKEESLFEVDDVLNTESGDADFAKIFSQATDKIYTTTIDSKIIRETDSHLGQFLINEIKETTWQLTNETKKIGDYVCYKATSILVVKNKKGNFKFPIIAWYCPKIAVNVGPKGYRGLPGLIFELQERNITYGFKSLSFSNERLKIVKPNKGKLVTGAEFDIILSQPFKG